MRFPFLPNQEGYSAQVIVPTVAAQDMEGGRSTRRLEFENVWIKFNVSWTFNDKQYDLFVQFYQDWLKDKNADGTLKLFDVLLIWHPVNPECPLNNFKCMFTDDPVKITSPDGLSIQVACSIQGYLDQQWPMSALYPLQSTDQIAVNQPQLTHADLWGLLPDDLSVGLPMFVGGEIVNYGTYVYTAPNEDVIQATLPLFLEGTITEYGTITYNAPNEDGMTTSLPVFISGEIKEYPTITYLNYAPEAMAVPTPAIFVEGTLT